VIRFGDRSLYMIRRHVTCARARVCVCVCVCVCVRECVCVFVDNQYESVRRAVKYIGSRNVITVATKIL
jgi:hypothetical protein